MRRTNQIAEAREKTELNENVNKLLFWTEEVLEKKLAEVKEDHRRSLLLQKF